MQSGSFPTRATAARCDLELVEINLFVSLVLAGAVSIPSTARPAELEAAKKAARRRKAK
jgi:hypothetical protein